MKYRYLRFPGGLPKAVTFSYDDGCRWDKDLAPIFNQYGVKGTFNINSSCVGASDWYLNKEEIKEYIVDGGHEIAVHGDKHIAPGVVRPIDGIKEYLNCRLKLEEMFGGIIRGMAYPNSGIKRMENGANYENIREYMKNLDIVYGRSLGGENDAFELPTDWLNWVPTMHHDHAYSLQWAQKFVELKCEEGYHTNRQPRLFYVWGHSYEFNQRNNWEHMHDLLKILANREDTWYATNIEIYEYVEAYNHLVFSADSTVIHNPTATKIWFMQDGGIYSINPGKTIKIDAKESTT